MGKKSHCRILSNFWQIPKTFVRFSAVKIIYNLVKLAYITPILSRLKGGRYKQYYLFFAKKMQFFLNF